MVAGAPRPWDSVISRSAGLGGDRGLAAKCTPSRCRICRRRAAEWIPFGGNPRKIDRRAGGDRSGTTGSEGERGTPSVLGGDGMWQGARRDASRRNRPVRRCDGSEGKAPAFAVPDLSGHGVRRRRLSAEGGSAADRGGIVRSPCNIATISAQTRGMAWPPSPSFLLWAESAARPAAWRSSYFLPGPIAP